MADPIVSVELDLDSKNFDKELDNQKRKIERAGKDAGDGFKKAFSGDIFGSLARQAAALGAVVAGALSFREAIRGAIEAQNSINAFNRALAATGQFSEKASLSFQQYADSIENTSAVSADATLSAASLIQSIGKLDVNTLKPATQAALDLSAALGVNLETAARLVGRAANGEVESFKKFGLEIKKGADDAQTFTNALTAINGAFGGANAGTLNTFSGQLTRLQNAFGSVLEEFGKAIVDSPLVIALIKTIADEFFKIKKTVEGFDLKNFFSIDDIIRFGTALNEFVVAPLELVFNLAKIVFNGINAVVAGSVAVIGQKVGFIADLLNKVGVDNGLTQAFQDFRESSSQVFSDVADDTKDSIDGLFDGTAFGKGEAFLDNLRTNLEQAKLAIDNSGISNSLSGGGKEDGEKPAGEVAFSDFFKSVKEGFVGTEDTLTQFQEKSKSFGAQVKANLQAGIANGAGQAFAAFGAAVAKGDNALSAFAKSALASIGQIAVQQGTAFILQGIGYLFTPQSALGPPLIKAGAALAAFGGGLAAATGGGVGGGGATSANGGDSIGGQSVTDPRTGLAAPQDRAEPNTAVTVNIQGDVFDSEETGLRISNILKESSLNNNVRATVFA